MAYRNLFQGKAHKFGDDITTDYIIAGKHRSKAEDVLDLKDYLFNEIRPGFAGTVTQGDILVAGENFGCGSSREHAATLIRACGIEVVLAKSFARIFYRNAINIGMLVIECDTEIIHDENLVEVRIDEGVVRNITSNAQTTFRPIPIALKSILQDGGLVNHLKNTPT